MADRTRVSDVAAAALGSAERTVWVDEPSGQESCHSCGGTEALVHLIIKVEGGATKTYPCCKACAIGGQGSIHGVVVPR